MKQGVLVAVGGAAIVVAGLSGCSSGDNSAAGSSSSSSSSSSESSSSAASTSAEASASTKVIIDGKDQNVTGSVVCTNLGDTIAIAIGQATTGIAATVTNGDSPTVKQVGLGNVDGAVLGYSQGVGGGEATVEKDGRDYVIKGKASGADLANPMAGLVTKDFEIDVTCP